MVKYFMLIICIIAFFIYPLYLRFIFKALSNNSDSSSIFSIKAGYTGFSLYSEFCRKENEDSKMKIDSNTEKAGKRSDQSQKDN